MEQRIIDLFLQRDIVYIRNNACKILQVGKPISSVGEPKTDLYIYIYYQRIKMKYLN